MPSSAVIARVVVLKPSGRDGGALPVTAQTLRSTGGNISFGRRVENTVRINKPCVSRSHSAIFFKKHAHNNVFRATLRTTSKTNPTLVNSDAHVHHGDADWALCHGDVITIGDRSFRFEYGAAAGGNAEMRAAAAAAGDQGGENSDRSNAAPAARAARFGSARKKKPQSVKKKNKKKKEEEEEEEEQRRRRWGNNNNNDKACVRSLSSGGGVESPGVAPKGVGASIVRSLQLPHS
jgi:pSer/pThr/pTyr-binding forkhead associated (FHA) protein